MKTNLHVRCFETLAELSSLEFDWNALAGDHALRRYDWLQSWWQHFGVADEFRGATHLFVVTVEDADGQPIGLAPWYRSQSAAGGHVIRFLGSGVVCTDHQAILCRSGRETEVIGALADWLVAPDTEPWSMLELTAVDCDDPVIPLLVDRLANHGHRIHQRAGDNCWCVELPDSWDDYVQTLTPKKRAQARRAVRNLFDTGHVVLHEVTSMERFDKAFAIFRHLHQKRRKSVGDPGCFHNPVFASFLRDTAERYVRAGRMDLLWLELDGTPIAAEFNPIGGGVIYSYQGGIDPDARRMQPGPGNLMNMACIRRAIERGDRAIDFMRGDEPYKKDWKAELRPQTEYRIVARRPADQLRHHAWRAEQQARRWAKWGLSAARDWNGRGKTSPKQRSKQTKDTMNPKEKAPSPRIAR